MLDKKDFKIIFRLKGEGDKMWQFNGLIETMAAPFDLGPMYRLVIVTDELKQASDIKLNIMKKIIHVCKRAVRMSGLKALGFYDQEFFELLGHSNHDEIKEWLGSFFDEGIVYATDMNGITHYFISLIKNNPWESFWISNVIESVEINSN